MWGKVLLVRWGKVLLVEGGGERWRQGARRPRLGGGNKNDPRTMGRRMCEDCALGQPRFGLPAEGGRRRWCGGCAKAHAGARDVVSRRCEDCALKVPSFGLPAEGRMR